MVGLVADLDAQSRHYMSGSHELVQPADRCLFAECPIPDFTRWKDPYFYYLQNLISRQILLVSCTMYDRAPKDP
ncbi:hypothetical protein N7510_001409 [Penicillium lagena]|uniref:uncharacterized protein n=1 Tax=Penicillium lagena TaxID=94218 RepID=UPI00254097D8|nr:uncharacterized protein N7510_001409 [Penicillium lagena]KAJ5625100.1 hypothetical protein N7510_001409 [Penicillium lagena]